MQPRPVSDLIDVDSPAWPEIAGLAASSSGCQVLAVDDAAGRDCLYRMQVSAASWLGALALNCGGIVAGDGWFRILGAGHEGLVGLADINGLPDDPAAVAEAPDYLLVGFDVLGGRFAIDGGGLGVNVGEVCYFGPDTLSWSGLGGGHADFVAAAISGALDEAFASLRWPGWQDDISCAELDQGIAVYPPPFTAEGKDLAATFKNPVPMAELFDFFDEAARALGPH